jgi:hypothetical protein
MTTKLSAPAAFAQFQTLGASYTADAKGIVAAAAAGDVIDLIRGGCTLLPAYNNLSATTDPGASSDNTQGYSVSSRWVVCHERRVSCLRRATVREMKEGPSSSVIRSRSQATASCCGQKPWW